MGPLEWSCGIAVIHNATRNVLVKSLNPVNQRWAKIESGESVIHEFMIYRIKGFLEVDSN